MTAAAARRAAPSKILATVDRVLADIGQARTVLEMKEQVLAHEIETVKVKYQEPIETAKAELAELERSCGACAGATRVRSSVPRTGWTWRVAAC